MTSAQLLSNFEPAAFLQSMAFRRDFFTFANWGLQSRIGFKIRLCAQIKTLNIMEGWCESRSAVGVYLGVPYWFDVSWGNPTCSWAHVGRHGWCRFASVELNSLCSILSPKWDLLLFHIFFGSKRIFLLHNLSDTYLAHMGHSGNPVSCLNAPAHGVQSWHSSFLWSKVTHFSLLLSLMQDNSTELGPVSPTCLVCTRTNYAFSAESLGLTRM